MNAKKLIALLLAAVMCVGFAACGGDDEPETTTNAPETTQAADATVADETTAAQADETTAADDTTAAAEDTTVAEESTAAEATSEEASTEEVTAQAAKKPETKAEIVEYYNKAANKVKTDAKSVNQLHITNYLANTPTIPGALEFVYNTIGGDDWLDGMLKDNSTGAATYTGADIDAKFPVENESWSSKLTADDVKSATCTESNGVYTITIVTKGDAKSDSIKHGQGHTPKAFNVVLPAVVNDNIPGIATSLVGTAQMEYPTGTIVVTVDAATGNIKTAKYDYQWTIHFTKMDAAVPLGTVNEYTINW